MLWLFAAQNSVAEEAEPTTVRAAANNAMGRRMPFLRAQLPAPTRHDERRRRVLLTPLHPNQTRRQMAAEAIATTRLINRPHLQHVVVLYMLLAAILIYYSQHPAPHAHMLAALLATVGCGLILPTLTLPPLPLLLRAMKRDATALGHLLFEMQEQDPLRDGLPWINAAIKEDVVVFKAMLADVARTLRVHWLAVLLPVAIGVCLGLAVPVLARWLVGGRDEGAGVGAATTTATTTVGELGPLGTCLVEAAGWTREVLRLERHVAEE